MQTSTRPATRRVLGGLFAACLAVAAGCGDDTADDPIREGPPDAPTPAPDLPPDEEGGTGNVTDDTAAHDTTPQPSPGAPTPDDG